MGHETIGGSFCGRNDDSRQHALHHRGVRRRRGMDCEGRHACGKIWFLGPGNRWKDLCYRRLERRENRRNRHEYDPSTDTWTDKANMPTARERMASAVVNGRIYVFGGTRSGSPLVTREAYDPASDTWTTKKAMPTSRLGITRLTPYCALYALTEVAVSGWEATDFLTKRDGTFIAQS
jgi:hypothetical protein